MLEIKAKADAIIEARRNNLPNVEEKASIVAGAIQELERSKRLFPMFCSMVKSWAKVTIKTCSTFREN